MLRGCNAESTVCVSYFDVKKELSNCCLPSKGFKRKNNIRLDVLKG